MTEDTLDITVTAIHPSSAEGRAVLTAYYHDIVSRYHGREATADEVGAAMRAEPSDDLCPPSGLLLVARRAATVLGCVVGEGQVLQGTGGGRAPVHFGPDGWRGHGPTVNDCRGHAGHCCAVSGAGPPGGCPATAPSALPRRYRKLLAMSGR